MIQHPLSGYNGGITGICSDRGDAGGYFGRFGQWAAVPIYNGYYIHWQTLLAEGINAEDCPVYVYEDGVLIETLTGRTDFWYRFDQNKHDVELVLTLAPNGWGGWLEPDPLRNTITLSLSHDNTAHEMTILRRSANGNTWYYADTLRDYEFILADAGTYGANRLTATGTPTSEIRGPGYALITMTDATTCEVRLVVLGVEIDASTFTISTEPFHAGMGLFLAFDADAYSAGDSWRVDITLPRTWTSEPMSRQETGLAGNVVVFRVDSTNDSATTTAGLESAAIRYEAIDPAPTLISQTYLTGHKLALVVEIGDLYEYHHYGDAVQSGTAGIAAYQSRGYAGDFDAHYWPTKTDMGGYAPGDQVSMILDVEEGQNLIEVRSIAASGHTSEPLKVNITVVDDALYEPPNLLSSLAVRKSGNTLYATTWVDATMTNISLWVSAELPWGSATSTTSVTPSAAGEELTVSLSVPSGTYYVGMSSTSAQPDVYTLININTIAPGGVVLDGSA